MIAAAIEARNIEKAAHGVLHLEDRLLRRQIILEPSDSRDALEMVKEFLGREPNNEALLKDLGLEVN